MDPVARYVPPDFDSPPLAESPPALLSPAPADGIAPDQFHATSNFPEYIRLEGQGWLGCGWSNRGTCAKASWW